MAQSQVLVFKTTVTTRQAVSSLTPVLNYVAGNGNWNFALDDCDRILRIQSAKVSAELAIFILNELGFECQELED